MRICTGLDIQPHIFMAARKKFDQSNICFIFPLADSLNKEGISYNYAGILVSEPENLKGKRLTRARLTSHLQIRQYIKCVSGMK